MQFGKDGLIFGNGCGVAMSAGRHVSERPAEIQIDVYDLLGRRVASLARGPWPAGAHEVQWNGEAPAGIYVLRYRYPGGQDRRGIVRVR